MPAFGDRFFLSPFLVAPIAVFLDTLLLGTLLSPVVGTVLYRLVRRGSAAGRAVSDLR